MSQIDHLILNIVDLDTTQLSSLIAQGSPSIDGNQLVQLLQDKSQIGCYIHVNHRLQDVMTISDSTYLVKLPMPTNKAQDEDKVSISFKKLSGNDDEEPLGRYEDTLAYFKAQGTGRVGKRWIQLGGGSSTQNRTPGRSSDMASPFRENQIGARALLYFYFGDKTQGASAIEQEIKRGKFSNIDESIVGTPGPFGQASSDVSGGHTPFRDRDIVNTTTSKFSLPANLNNTNFGRAQSTEKKGGNSIIDQNVKNAQRRQTVAASKGNGSVRNNGIQESLDDVQSRFSKARLSVNTATLDDGHFTSRIPREIRHDPEIEEKVEQLGEATRAYLAFDMNRFQSAMNKELETHIQKLNHEYKDHQGHVAMRLDKCEAQNSESIQLKSQMVDFRLQKHSALVEVSQQSEDYQAKFAIVNSSKQQMRLQLSDIEKKLREIQREIASTNLENSTLKALIRGEQELREERAQEELVAITLSTDDLMIQQSLTSEDLLRVQRQREFAEASSQGLEQIATDSQIKAQDLLKYIELQKLRTIEQLQTAENDLKVIIQENKQLKLQKEKNDQNQRQLEREFEQLSRQEKSQREEWTKKVNDLEKSIHDKRDMIHELIGNLSSVNQEISALRVQTQTAQYKVEYQQAMREMHDNNQYEYKLRKLASDVEQSNRKALNLENELKRICEAWDLEYEEAMIQMRARLDELGTGVTFEAIEKLLLQISEKDKVIGKLSSAVHEMRNEVNKMTNNGHQQEILDEAQKDCQMRMSVYRQLLAEKAILYDQLLGSTKQLVHRDDIILKNEQEMIKLKYHNDIQKLEIYQKRELLIELEGELEREKGRYKSLKTELKRLEKQADHLKQVLKQKEEDIELLEEMLQDRDNVIEELERQLSSGDVESVRTAIQSAKSSVRPAAQMKKLNWYRPIKGDLIDELIAKYFNALPRPMPIKRLGDGFYIFGTRKIYVKLLQGRLVVRVGGGFMSIDEFMIQYAEMELNKVQQMIDNGNFNMDEFVDTQYAEISGTPPQKGGRKSMSRSPNRGSPKY